MSYLFKVFYSILYIEEIVKYITRKTLLLKWRIPKLSNTKKFI